jgi:hypothetical protein
MLLLIAKAFVGAFAWALPGLPTAGGVGMIAAIWTLRFVLYVFGARDGWDYGYGVNGVIVSRRLRLKDKARRIAADWFGVVLVLAWAYVTIGAMV